MRKGARYGTLAGVLVWLFGGIVVGFHLGGYGAVALLAKLSGGPIEANLVARAFVVAGMLVGIVCTGTSAVVLGGVLGATLGALVDRGKALVHREA